MKKIFIVASLCMLSFEMSFAGLIIGQIEGKKVPVDNSPIEICCGNEQIYYPSRIIDVNQINKNCIDYNLHIVCLDSCSNPQIKTVQVPIPKDLCFVQCRVGSEYEFLFEGDERFVIVTVPTAAVDTLSRSFYNDLFQNAQKGPGVELLKGDYQVGRVHPSCWVGAFQLDAFNIRYFNFNDKQNRQYKKILGL